MNFKTQPSWFFLLILLFSIVPTALQAHSPNQSYLVFRIYQDDMGGRFEATAKDLNRSLGLQLPEAMTLEDIRPHLDQIYEYFQSKASFRDGNKNYPFKFKEPTILELEEMENFVRFNFDFIDVDKIPDQLDIRYEAFFDTDPIHTGMCIVEYNWKAGILDNGSMISLIFGKSDPQQELSLKDNSIWKGFWALVKLGVWHIWIGLDHILFILALILPSVVRRRQELTDLSTVVEMPDRYSKSWLPVKKFKPAFWYILKIITFFTIAHSITLAIAALGIFDMNSRFVESIIALSIALAAIHNIYPVFKHKEWIIAFGFGLFHGFGFASVLGDKGLGGDYLVPSLLGFNVGVELGQVLIICLIFPFLFLLRKLLVYPKILKYGSMILILISLYWFIERGFEVDLPAGALFWKVYNAIF